MPFQKCLGSVFCMRAVKIVLNTYSNRDKSFKVSLQNFLFTFIFLQQIVLIKWQPFESHTYSGSIQQPCLQTNDSPLCRIFAKYLPDKNHSVILSSVWRITRRFKCEYFYRFTYDTMWNAPTWVSKINFYVSFSLEKGEKVMGYHQSGASHKCKTSAQEKNCCVGLGVHFGFFLKLFCLLVWLFLVFVFGGFLFGFYFLFCFFWVWDCFGFFFLILKS